MKYQIGKTGRVVLARFEDHEDILGNINMVAKKEDPSSMRKCNTWRNSLIAGTLGGYGKRIQAHQFRGEG